MGNAVRRAVVLLLLLGTSCSPGSSNKILLVTIDTLRADRVGYAGHDVETPNLDALARSGATFSQAVSAAPLTLPSHATILTGLYPPRHGVRNNGTFTLPREVETVPERLKAAGFATGAFVGAFVLDSRFGLEQGFDRYDDDLPEENPLSNAYYAERSAEEVVSRAIEWMEGRKDEKLFVWVHLFDCHAPYVPPEPFDRRYPSRPYDGEIAHVDRALGPLLERFEDGVTIVTSDHGESLGEHGESTHALFVYDATMRVPLLLRAPGVKAGSSVEAQVRTADIAPTILELAGLEAAAGLDGTSLVAFLRGEETASRAAYGESFTPFFNFNWAKLRSIRDGRYKLIDAPRRELYDLEADPAEATNLWGGDPHPSARGLLQELDRVLALDAGGGAVSEAPLDEDTSRRLESLGYLSSSSSVRSEAGASLPDPKDRIEVYEKLHGILARQDQRPDELVAEYRAVLDLEPENVWARIRLANLLADEERYEEALVEYRALIDASAMDARAFQNVGVALLLLDRVDEALEFTEDAVEARPWDPDVHVLRGEALERAKRAEEAKIAYERAIELEPEDAENYWRRGAVLQKLERLSEAEIELRRAVEMEPDLEPARLALARLLTASGREAEALLVLERASAEASPGVKAGLAEIELASGRREEALRLLEEARAEDPENARVLVLLGPIYAQGGRLDDARAVLERALALGERSPDVRRNLALVYLQSGETPAAILELQTASRDAPTDASIWFSLGNAYLRAGKFREAVAALEQTVELDPGREEALFNLALAYEQKGENRLAAEAYRRYLTTGVQDAQRREEAQKRIARLTEQS
jgi:arylsulfatase A-like enzyme/Flp pilus assembly protein TadD